MKEFIKERKRKVGRMKGAKVQITKELVTCRAERQGGVVGVCLISQKQEDR